ncbi:hypothetical protein HOY80DRAFT_985353 [Tuber brumale]|nr:hypothetical protein HOY80DRAFT_985353 [Tuber brumale]
MHPREACEKTMSSWLWCIWLQSVLCKSQVRALLAVSNGTGLLGCFYVFAAMKRFNFILRTKTAIPVNDFKHDSNMIHYTRGDGSGQ